MKRNFHPSGSAHWTRQPGVERTPWTKLKPKKVDDLCDRYKAGVRQTELSAIFRIGRTTVWRYLRRRGLVKGRDVSGVPRFTSKEVGN